MKCTPLTQWLAQLADYRKKQALTNFRCFGRRFMLLSILPNWSNIVARDGPTNLRETKKNWIKGGHKMNIPPLVFSQTITHSQNEIAKSVTPTVKLLFSSKFKNVAQTQSFSFLWTISSMIRLKISNWFICIYICIYIILIYISVHKKLNYYVPKRYFKLMQLFNYIM